MQQEGLVPFRLAKLSATSDYISALQSVHQQRLLEKKRFRVRVVVPGENDLGSHAESFLNDAAIVRRSATSEYAAARGASDSRPTTIDLVCSTRRSLCNQRK